LAKNLPPKKMPEKNLNDWTIIKILSWTESYFQDHSVDSPRLTAEILLAYSLDIKRLDLYLQFDRPLHASELSYFKILIQRRVQNEPVAYITGEKGFFESDFRVAQGVLIPRPDTETLVEQALMILSSGKDSPEFNAFGSKTILELGVGSGAIIVSIAKARPEFEYFACDVSQPALKIAKINAQKIIPDKIKFFSSDWFSSVKEKERFDLIVSNPPYIATADIENLEPEIRKFEPLLALDGGLDGLDCYDIILNDAHRYLVPGGVILLEIGFDQKEGLENIFNQHPQYTSIGFIKDLAGHNRVAFIKKSID
jgi:release factor glutamine methyltransferase